MKGWNVCGDTAACALAVITLAAGACARPSPVPEIETSLTRPYLMGFSVIPPRPDIGVALRSMGVWTKRADAAIMHMDVPWALLLAGTSPEDALRKDGIDLARHYRSKNLKLVVTIDVTNGLAREREAVALVTASRSIAEPEIQRLYRKFALAVVEQLRPDYLGLAAETNLVRAIAPRSVYDALVRMTRDASKEIRASPHGSALPLYISVQVETAWGRLLQRGSYVGIDADLRDFPFITVLGLSSYPYLGGFSEPEQIPLEYYSRINAKNPLPLLIVEGGWPSTSVRGTFTSSPVLQARYVSRHSEILQHANAVAAFQLPFADLDLASFPKPLPEILPLFATLGLVDSNLKPKPALATWDSIFARRVER
jgi:hypothetical protein